MQAHLDLFFYSIAGKMLSGIFSKEKTAKTKKCRKCLRRIKITYDKCPHCMSAGFVFDKEEKLAL